MGRPEPWHAHGGTRCRGLADVHALPPGFSPPARPASVSLPKPARWEQESRGSQSGPGADLAPAGHRSGLGVRSAGREVWGRRAGPLWLVPSLGQGHVLALGVSVDLTAPDLIAGSRGSSGALSGTGHFLQRRRSTDRLGVRHPCGRFVLTPRSDAPTLSNVLWWLSRLSPEQSERHGSCPTWLTFP